MICISDGLIQKYADGETTPGETAKIEKHFLSCHSCSERAEHQKRLAKAVKNAYGRFSRQTLTAPRFQAPGEPVKSRRKLVKHLSWSAAAACFLLFLFLYNTVKPAQLAVSEIDISIEVEVDANQPISDLPLILNFTDSNGRVFEYLPGNQIDN